MNQFLLDTHTWLWMLSDSARLGPKIRHVLGHPDDTRFVSAVSFAELAIKNARGRLPLPVETDRLLAGGQFRELDLSSDAAFQSGRLPWHHKDPFDRLLVAQARSLGCPLVSADKILAQYDVKLIDPTL